MNLPKFVKKIDSFSLILYYSLLQTYWKKDENSQEQKRCNYFLLSKLPFKFCYLFIGFHLLTPTFKFLDEHVESSHEVLDAITTNNVAKKILPCILGKIGRDDLQEKVSQCFLKQSRG